MMRIVARRMNDDCSHCHLASRVRAVGKNAFDGTGTVVAPGAATITVLNVARVRPGAVLGPVLARAFARLALILRSLVKARFSSGARLDDFILPFLDLLHVAPQRGTEDGAAPIDLTQAGVATALRDGR